MCCNQMVTFSMIKQKLCFALFTEFVSIIQAKNQVKLFLMRYC